jgi:hypothetical protein
MGIISDTLGPAFRRHWHCAALIGLLASVAVTAAHDAATVALPAPNEWQYLTFEQRHEQMTFLVHPSVAEHYQDFYKTSAPLLNCRSCHGEQAERQRYQMAYTPIDDLDPARVRELYVAGAKLSPEQIFKRDVITPLMARLLGVPAYDAVTGNGFSCFGCHPREGG